MIEEYLIKIEEYLIAYGPLGAWTIWLLYEKSRMLTEFKNILKANTDALIKLQSCIKK